jgi:HAE1 family hydrophobic/amphiphilic exporter-1/multidrug efflux pump
MSLSTLSIKTGNDDCYESNVLFGIIGYTYLGVREFPSIDPAQVSIRTNYTGPTQILLSPKSLNHWRSY